MNIAQRIAIEKRIIKRIIADALAAGYRLSVDDGESRTINRSSDHEAILSAMMTTDEDYLLFYAPGDKVQSGWVYFVYGNDGHDVVNDYTENLEEVMKSANALADQIEEKLS